MNKSELIEALAAKTEVSKAAAGKSVDALVEIITAAVAKGNDVALIGFGTFKAKLKKARTARNPHNNQPVHVPARTALCFEPASNLKSL